MNYAYKDFINVIDIQQTVSELQDFINVLHNSPKSKFGGYDRLGEYEDMKFTFVQGKLRRYKFVNGEPDRNTIEVNSYAAFYWCIHNSMSNTLYQYPFLHHHASAYERYKVDVFILRCIIAELTESRMIPPKIGKLKYNSRTYNVKYFHDYSPTGCSGQLFEVITSTKKLVLSNVERIDE